MPAGVPPWPGEDHTCAECGMAYAAVEVSSIPAALREVAGQLRAAVTALGPAELRRRPEPLVWAPIEYLCHVRDVYTVTTIRLYRARTEDRPAIEPVFNDLRALRFRYLDRDPGAVLDELDAAVAGCCDEVAEVTDWDRTVTRLAGEQRTTRWLARAALHEGRHHLLDITGAIAAR